MVIITAAINNPAPSHATSLLGAVGALARARVGTTFLRINFTCTPKLVEGPALSIGPALCRAEIPLHPRQPIEKIMAAVEVSVVALGRV